MSHETHPRHAVFADLAQVVWQGDATAARRLCATAAEPMARTLAGLSIHASTTRQTLTRALAEAVPSVAAALSPDDFAALAREFIVQYPPRRPALHDWGDELPEFLAHRSMDSRLVGWARLDRAWLAALFAPDAQPIDAARLAALAPADIPRARLVSHPSLQFIRLDDRWFGSWLDLGAVLQVESRWQPEADGRHVAIARPGAQVRALALSPTAYAFLESLHHRQSLAQAYETVCAEGPPFDLQTTLAGLFANGLFAEILSGSSKP